MRILIIHHLEKMWDQEYRKFNTTFEEQVELVLQHLEENEYDRVILTRFENHELGEEHCQLAHLIDVVHVYGYGWDHEMMDQGSFSSDQKWTDGGNHSEIVLIDKWMEQLQGHEVSLCGAFDGECIEDMEIALEGANVQFNRINELIV